MTHILHSLFLIFFIISGSYGQETIYYSNGNRSTGKITGSEGEKIKISVDRNGKISTYNLRRENILLALANDGRFLIINRLEQDPVRAQAEIDAFNKAPKRQLNYDLLLKFTPTTVISGNIIYESDDVVNYKTLSGAPASINKREIAAIFYKTGKHYMAQSPAAILGALQSAQAELMRASAQTSNAKPVNLKPTKLNSKSPANRAVTKTGSETTGNPVKAKPSNSPEPTPNNRQYNSNSPKPTLTDEQYAQYRKSALQMVDQFVVYLNIITDKALDDEQKDKAVEAATALFMPDATIDVTSANKPGVRKHPVSSYLKRLKMLSYASTSIEWTEIQYMSELTQAADGNYYGLITGQQTFTGYAENGQDVLYSDVMQKSIKVKLEAYRKSEDTGAVLKWAVLLGNIGVVTK